MDWKVPGFYMGLNFRQDIRVRYIKGNGEMLVEFTRPRRYGYAKAFMSFQGEIRMNRGFNLADLEFLHKFFQNNKDCIIDLVVEDKQKRKIRTWIPQRYIDDMRQ